MGNPLRILHVVVNMNRGGAETLIMSLYRHIDRSQIQFDFLTCKEGVFDSEIIELGGRVHRIPYITDVGHFGYLKGLKQFFMTHPDYSIVHSHMDKMSGLVLQQAKLAGVSVRIAHSHNTRSEGGITARLYKWYAGLNILQNATNLLACSNAAANWLYRKKAKEAFVLKNGIDTEEFYFSSMIRKKIREELKISDDCFVVGHVGRFVHQKNHTYLIDIFHQFHKEINNTILLLAGDGPLRKEMEEKVKMLNLENHVKFLGIQSEIHRLLQAFDVFVFPSKHEGLPVTLIEAQGSGLPCIISEEISNETDLDVQLIHFLPLNKVSDWVRKLVEIRTSKHCRLIPKEAISTKGYDIKSSTSILEEYYLVAKG